MITQKIMVDVNHTKNPEPIVCRIGESGTRIIRFELVEYVEGVAEAVTYSQENPTAQLRIVKPDNTFIIVNAVRAEPTENVLFDVVIPAEAAQVVGIGFYDFRIYDGADEEPAPDAFLYTEHGQVIIDDDMLTDEMIESVAAVNGLIFPDDFLTSADLSDYATKQYVDDSIATIPDPLDTYSTTERKVGTWIDGKDVFEKVVDTGQLPSGSKTVLHGISGIDTLVSVNGIATNTNTGISLCLPYVSVVASNQCGIAVYPTYIEITCGNFTAYNKSHVILRYTKS